MVCIGCLKGAHTLSQAWQAHPNIQLCRWVFLPFRGSCQLLPDRKWEIFSFAVRCRF